MSFEAWIGEVNDLCFLEFGMSIHDLPDMPLYDAYESGETPEEFMAENLGDLDALAELVLS